MTGRQGRTLSGEPARSEKEELKRKGRSKLMQSEKSGSKDDGSSNHPVTKETGVHQDSNAGQDSLSGDEGVDFSKLEDGSGR